MKFKKTALSTAVLVTLGLGGMAVGPVASAAVLPNGNYLATINVTPLTVFNGHTYPVTGSDGAWNSTFTFGGGPSSTAAIGMTDNATDIATNPAAQTGPFYGSSKKGDGAGSWNMTVSGGSGGTNQSFTTSNFQVDAIFATAGGTFVQYGSIGSGTITPTGDITVLDPSGREGAVNGPVDANGNIVLYNEPWSIPPASGDVPVNATTGYAEFTTGTTSNTGTGSGTITGHDIVPLAGGGYNVILVSAGNVGSAWGSSFSGASYMETWNVHLAPVPIPAAAWLFGSGLIGLVGIARRKKSS